MTAELLRQAADAIEQHAAATTPGPWELEYGYKNDIGQAVFVMDPDYPDDYDQSTGIGCFNTDGDNRWAVLLGPQVAAPLAAWLRSAAEDAEQVGADHRAVAFANQILAGVPAK